MDMLKITGLAVVAVSLSVLLRQKNPEYSLMLSLASGILIISMLISSASPLFERIGGLLEASGAQAEYVQILFKSLGLCFVTQIAFDGCRDLGETAIASKVETAGKISVLLVSLPLFEQVLSIVNSLIG